VLGSRGVADIAFFNAMGLVANGMGNYEFDGGIDDFAPHAGGGKYPFIAVNLDFSRVRLKPDSPPIGWGGMAAAWRRTPVASE
jgi:2',3'-cyclic-nucleotide 2'-phosphodiesterase (5'-nucleotidase family)